MKVIQKITALSLLLLLLADSASATNKKSVAVDEDEDVPEVSFSHSKKLAVPDTSSKVVTTPQKMHLSLTAIQFTKMMGNGINLGNTMEAFGRSKYGPNKDPSTYETFWGQPITTQKLMEGYKKAGFDSIRIPVAWTNAMAFETGDYTIGTAYLDRIETIVNYALKAGLIVVFNDHWDGSWWGMFGSADKNTRNDAMDMYIAMWTQLANRFKNYSDYVVFEGANEEIGARLNDKDVAKDSGTLSEDECYAQANSINQTFVDTVRKTGGNNANRFLLIPGYDTNITKTCDERFEMPKDTAKNKLIVSVHFYDPSPFCIAPGSNHWGTTSDYGNQNSSFEKLASFTEKGYGVIIGEYGVSTKKDGTKKNDMSAWLNNVLDNCDYYGYCPMLWDCNTFFKKDVCAFPDKEIAAIYAGRNYAAQSKMTDEEIQTAADNRIQDRFDDSPAMLSDNPFVGKTDVSAAWIMYNSKDWSVTYSVGDTYNPDSYTDGIKATDVQITGPGTYTVALDFTGIDGGFTNSFAFSAIGISNGEQLFPGYVISIKEIKVNGKPYKLIANAYTATDDKKCTRCNIYNEWVTKIPNDIRYPKDIKKDSLSAVIVNQKDPELSQIKTLSVTFDFEPGK